MCSYAYARVCMYVQVLAGGEKVEHQSGAVKVERQMRDAASDCKE